MQEICVAHLVRAQNGIGPFKIFLESYRENPSEVEHELMIIFKGFNHLQDAEEYRILLAPFEHVTFEVPDEGFDIAAYFSVINRYSEKYRYFCFLNSYSVILDHDWLKKLYEGLTKPGVGLVGATGSWNSNCTNAYAWFRRIGARVLSWSNKKYLTRTGTENRSPETISFLGKFISMVKGCWTHFHQLIHFAPFPNYHIRTNAFMISGELMKSLKCPSLKTKMDAYKFESGRSGLTRQILKKGKGVIVVGKDGVGYEKEDWSESGTFWQSDQENLIVSDNQTRDYQDGSPERRRYLSSVAWGAAR